MASIIVVGKYLHIQWYDTILNKTLRKSTKLLNTHANRVKADKIASQLQLELSRKSSEMKGFRLKTNTIGAAFNQLFEIYTGAPVKTLKDMERFRQMFLKHFNEDNPVHKINKLSAEQFLIEVKKLPLKQNSIHGYGKRLRHFLNFLFEYKYIPIFIINKKIMTKPELVPKIIFNEEHFQKIFMNLYKKNDNFITAVFLLAYTGLRSSDVLEIRCEDIDLERRTLRFYSPKRKKSKEIGFHKDLVQILANRINLVKTGKIIDYANYESLGRAITTYYKQIGIGGNKYVARTFRKFFVTYCRNVLKIDRSVVESMVGHEHGTVSDRHYNNISPEDMNEELTKFNLPLVDWMNKSNPKNSAEDI